MEQKQVLEKLLEEISAHTSEDVLSKIYSQKQFLNFKKSFKAQLKEEIYKNSILQYKLMQESNDWTEAGRDQVESSFISNILQLGIDHSLNFLDYTKFKYEIEEKITKYGFNTLTLTELKDRLKDFPITIEGHTFYVVDIDTLNKILRILKEKWVIQGGYYGPHIELILGKGESSFRGEYRVIEIEEELIRTPSTIAAMAAVMGNKEVYLRKLAFKNIVNCKWKCMLESNAYSDKTEGLEIKLSEEFKKKTLESYEINTYSQFQKKEGLFLEELSDTVTCHELGHTIIQYQLLDKEVATHAESTKLYKETIITDLLELLADIAPLKEGLYGPFYNFIFISKKDIKKATRMAWMYASDTWFFDTKDKYMYGYSDFLSILYAKIVSEEGELQFNVLEALLETKDPEKNLIVFAINAVKEAIEGILKILQNKTFKGDTYSVFYERCIEEAKKKYAHKKSILEYEKSVGEWSKVHEKILEEHPDVDSEITQFLKAFKLRKTKEMYMLCFGQENKADVRTKIHETLGQKLKLK